MMNEKIPLKLLKPYTLAEVPRSEYVDQPSPRNLSKEGDRLSFFQRLRKSPPKQTVVEDKNRKQILEFNVAAWLRVPESMNQMVSLLLCYGDSSGEYGVLVDEAEINERFALMLAGKVTLETKGELQYVRAACAGVREGQIVLIDELYAQRIRSEKAQKTVRNIA